MSKIDGRFLSIDPQIENIQKILSTEQVDPTQLKAASDQLHQMENILAEALQNNDLWQNDYAKNIERQKEELISLTGRLHEMTVKNEIRSIKEEAGKISRQEHSLERLAAVQAQKARIQAFIHNNALSLEQRKEINRAHSSLKASEQDIRTKTQDVVISSLPYQQLIEETQKDFNSNKVVPLLPAAEVLTQETKHEIAFQLFAMAESLYENDRKNFFKNYNQLPVSIKEKLSLFLKETDGNIFALSNEQDVTKLRKNILNTVKALIGLAHDITDSSMLEKIPSDEDIQIIFEDLRTIKEDH